MRLLAATCLACAGSGLLIAGLVRLGWMRHGAAVYDFRFLHLDWVLDPSLPHWLPHMANLATALVGIVLIAGGMTVVLTRGNTSMGVDPADVATLGAKVDAWVELETALRDDVLGVFDLLDSAPDNQSLRRALIRSLWGFVEGSVYGISDFLRTARALSSSDDADGLPDRGKTIERVKSVLKTAGKDLAGWEPDFGTTGWEALRANLKVRDRLMHPKSGSDVRITDEEVDQAKDGAAWFLETIVEIQTRALQRSHQ